MPYTPFTVEQFGGLDVLNDPQEVGANGATDLLNVDFDKRGRVRTRYGYYQFDVSGGTAAYRTKPFAATFAGTDLLLLMRLAGGANFNLDKMTTSGAITNVGSWAGTGTTNSIVSLGTPTTTLVFIATDSSTSGVTLRKYDGTTLGTSTGKPRYVGVTPVDNRLVQGYFFAAADSPSGANGSPSTVFFSDPGAPETYGANNYVHLSPGDGEVITAIATWRDSVFVFKETKLFVFYGTSTDAAGNPVFNSRRVELPSPTEGRVAVGNDGVYVSCASGIYFTSGGSPSLISGVLQPIFDRTTGNNSLDPAGGSTMPLDWARERLYAHYGSNDPRTLVYDTRYNVWTVWNLGSNDARVTAWAAGTLPLDENVYVVKADSHVYRFDSAQTTDAGTAIESYYQSGFYDLGNPERKVVRETLLWGTGTPTLSVFTDHGTSDANAAAVTLGTSPAVAEGRQRIARRGVFFSHKFRATSGAWTIHRLTHNIRESRLPGTKPT